MNLENNIIDQLSRNKLAICWLRNGVILLALAGVYSIILVMLRTPILVTLFPNTEIFKSALVIHVNLSILVWLISVTACIWSHNLQPTTSSITYVIIAFFGTALIALSPLCGQNLPVMNNYIPMLENIMFILGISLFGVSVLLFSSNVILATIKTLKSQKLINFTILSTTIMWVLVWVCFICSYYQLQQVIKLVPVDIEFYYELLFWSGGHLLQFIYTQIMILVMTVLCHAWIGKELKFNKLYLLLLYLNFLISIAAIWGHLSYDIIDAEFKEYYTKQMKYGGGIAPVLSLILIFYELVSHNHKLVVNSLMRNSPIKASIICSSILFLSGGFIGVLITSMNVTVPAHYNGSIVGISVAFMGFSFLLCDNACDNEQKKNSYSSAAIITLTIGQMLHIIALLLAGGYGVMRKTPGVEMTISSKLLMGAMGGGGLIAIVGGLMFVVICGKKMVLK
ncbi:cbb3-type cytochrome c oxidase subunit I [Candidatus Tisiphia endosymbiont of Sialis lutaria]|uniref:cbb3-type cytochrome c oxidase subunit I n=1 Tax=Candidatus Tisiphia endosymbiont of Sialis lutaria TaxID=2029164 RepID=UPI00312C7471